VPGLIVAELPRSRLKMNSDLSASRTESLNFFARGSASMLAC
jgi:hypothetical protein